MPLSNLTFGSDIPMSGSNRPNYFHGGNTPGAATAAPIGPTGFVGAVHPEATKATGTLTGPQHQIINSLSNTLYHQLGQPNPTYAGPGIPGATDSQRLAFGMAPGMAGQQVGGIQGALEGMVLGQTNPDEVTEYYNRAVRDPALADFDNTLMKLGERYGDVYGTSGGHLRGLGEATRDFHTNLSGHLAGLQFGEREAARSRQGHGISLAQQENQRLISNMLGLGGQERAIEAQMNQGDLAAWEAQQGYNNPWLNALGGPVLGTAGGVKQTESPSTLSQVMQGIGGVGQLVGGIASIFA